MDTLTVIFDPDCGLCWKAKEHFARQPTYLPLVFLAAGSRETAQRFPTLDQRALREELVAVDDAGGVYLGTNAYLMALWATRSYRELALRLAEPGLAPLARAAFHALTRGRHTLSRLLGLDAPRLQATLEQERPLACTPSTPAPNAGGIRIGRRDDQPPPPE